MLSVVVVVVLLLDAAVEVADDDLASWRAIIARFQSGMSAVLSVVTADDADVLEADDPAGVAHSPGIAAVVLVVVRDAYALPPAAPLAALNIM